MGIRGLFRSKDTKEEDNIAQEISEATTSVIKRLSGGDIRHERKLIDNVVIITNASGGTGASTLASNIAYMAGEKDMRVLLIDLNILLPIQYNYFNIKQAIEKPDLVSFLTGHNALGESIVNTRKNISLLFANNRGLMDYINTESDLSVANFLSGLDNLRELYDLILIDAPMRIEHTLINSAFYVSDQIYIVWDEGISCIANTEKIRQNMAFAGIDVYTKMRVILNKRTSIHYSDYPFKKLNIELVGILPFDSEIIDSSLRSQVFCEKGESKAYNSKVFYNEIENITSSILENGGYIK